MLLSFSSFAQSQCENLISDPFYPAYDTLKNIFNAQSNLKYQVEVDDESQYCDKLKNAYISYINNYGQIRFNNHNIKNYITNCKVRYANHPIELEAEMIKFDRIKRIINSCDIMTFAP